MTIKNVLDQSGNVIGTLELPDSTSVDVWDDSLSLYSDPVPTVYVSDQTLADIAFGVTVTALWNTENVTLGIVTSGKSSDLQSYMATWLSHLSLGAIRLAINVLDIYIADSSTAKTNLSPFVTNARLATYQTQLRSYLV